MGSLSKYSYIRDYGFNVSIINLVYESHYGHCSTHNKYGLETQDFQGEIRELLRAEQTI